VTAANASTLNDGASAIILASLKKAQSLGLKPLARVIGFADAAQAPIDFPTSPSKSIPIALQRAGLKISDIDFWEINQAFAVVSLANMKVHCGLKLDIYFKLLIFIIVWKKVIFCRYCNWIPKK
jgi:acetyl-CoA C-acetyltransferase